MYTDLIPKINEDIKRTKKAIISIGCSFVQGHGAISEDIYNNYTWEGLQHNSVNWKLSESDIVELTTKYPEIVRAPHGGVNFSFHEVKNSFVTVLCEKYFNGEYAAINLGRSGNGNRASIKDLYYYPKLLWDEIEEIIVIYCPSGAERLDFVKDTSHDVNDHWRWVTAWPHEVDNGKGARNTLWTGYRDALYSDKQQILEQIAIIQELLTWCKWKNAKLIVTPAFMRYYSHEQMYGAIRKMVYRDDATHEIIKTEPWVLNNSTVDEVLKMWPWENVFLPDGKPTFVDLVMAQEFPNWESNECPGFYSYQGRGTPGQWITPCSHPSAKGHDLFAKLLHQHIIEKL